MACVLMVATDFLHVDLLLAVSHIAFSWRAAEVPMLSLHRDPRPYGGVAVASESIHQRPACCVGPRSAEMRLDRTRDTRWYSLLLSRR
jgi:hypothetical protein